MLFVLLLPAAMAGDYNGKKILHVDSYHQGNHWNDAIAGALGQTLAGTGVELKILRLDTKRNPSEAFKQQAALRAKRVIEAFQPDVVTASDDNASRYLIMPYYKDAELPFVFCGVNWDASVYGFPYKNVTGMVEVSPIPKIIEMLKRYAEGDKIGFLAEDTPTKHKEMVFHETLFGIRYDGVYLVNSFAQWRQRFLEAQQEMDMLVILGVAALDDWDDVAAQDFAEQNTRIPTGTDFGWLMHLALLGVGKSPEEQGRWAAKAALKILDGVPPGNIPLAHNKEGTLYFNKTIAARLGIDEVPPLAEVVPRDD
jgi:ABC-type uncharacterized transport system substrate-binding protein